MSSKKAREKWNAEHYTHINIALDKVLVSGFKAVCARDGVSIAGTIGAFMRASIGSQEEPRKSDECRASPNTRAHRRVEVQKIMSKLEDIRDAEEVYSGRIPENLQGSIRAEASAISVSMLSDAIEVLSDAY
jgi:hypothetical protein